MAVVRRFSIKQSTPTISRPGGDLRTISNLANEICGECVPRTYAPALKQWMDQIQELAKRIA